MGDIWEPICIGACGHVYMFLTAARDYLFLFKTHIMKCTACLSNEDVACTHIYIAEFLIMFNMACACVAT